MMNCQMAAEMLDKENATVVINDDVAVENSTYTTGRRGVAGTLLVERIVGAAAEQGLALAELKAVGDSVNRCTASMGVALSSCTVPAAGQPTFPLSHYKNTDYAVFFGAQTTQKPKKYDRASATANAAIAARLPYVLATSRFAHFLKVMARDKIGSFLEASDCEAWLNRWIRNYVNGNQQASAEMKAKYPLAEAKVTVKEIAGAPGSYNAVAYMRPWLQMEELTPSMRLVARIPQMG